jgi:hypothetical protein
MLLSLRFSSLVSLARLPIAPPALCQVCYPVTQHLALCGDPANTLSGDVGPVKIGQLLPLKLDCKWTIPDGAPPLLAEMDS